MTLSSVSFLLRQMIRLEPQKSWKKGSRSEIFRRSQVLVSTWFMPGALYRFVLPQTVPAIAWYRSDSTAKVDMISI